MTVSYTSQAKPTVSYTKQSMTAAGAGTVFYGWLFWFTIATGAPTYSKVAKVAGSLTNVAKP